MAVDICVLGRFAIVVDGVAADERRLGDLGRLALAYLVLERHRPVARDELADALWGEHLPATWEAALRGVVSRLRSTLAGAGLDGADAVRNRFGCYQLHLPGPVVVDVEQVTAGVAEAERTLAVTPDRSRRAAVGACELAGRRFLPGASGTWVERRQDELAALQVRALELWSAAASACADHGTAATAAEQAIALAPLRESAHQRLMAAHAGAGNRGAALRAYARCRGLLVEELGVSPSGETEALYLRLLDDEPAPVAPPPPPSNLPASATSFVGRSRETDELERLLGSTRLLTLTGPGGVGKSRLALHLAEHLVERYPDGVWLAELAGLADPALVAQQVSSVLGAPERSGLPATDSLARFVAGRRLLLVLDNCEHLVSACATLADLLLRSSRELTVVTTSRAPLGVAGETTWVVPPLAIAGPRRAGHPAPPLDDHSGDADDADDADADEAAKPFRHRALAAGDAADADEAAELFRHRALAAGDAAEADEAAELFRHRALAAAPDLDLDAAARHIAVICARLEGIPLAIELAAARMRALSVAEIAARLDDHLRLLVGGPQVGPSRHQTLRGAVDWSFAALSEVEQGLFAHLSVFAGGWRLAAAEAVCGDPGDPGVDIVEALGGLVDKSLVSADRHGDDVRYRMLETLRQYAAEHLGAGGDEHAVRDRHLRWAVALAEAAEPGLEGDEQTGWLTTLDREHDNIRRALDWAEARGLVDPGLRLAASLVRFWEIRGYFDEGRSRLDAFIGRGDGPPALRARAVNSAALLAQHQGDLPAARALYQECLVTLRALDDRRGIATALHGLANVAVADGDLVTARALFEENLTVARQLGWAPMVAASLMNLGVVAQSSFMNRHRPMEESGPEARGHYEQSLACYEALGDRYGVAIALENLGALERYLRGAEVARQFHERSLAIRRELGDKQGIARSARFLGAIARHSGKMATARQLHEERLAIERELGNLGQLAEALTDLGDTARHEGSLDEARQLLEEGRAMYLAGGNPRAATRVAGPLSEVARAQGRFDEARALLEESLDMARELDNHHGEAWAVVDLAQVALDRGDAGSAADLARQALDLVDAHHLPGVEAKVLDLLACVAADHRRFEAMGRLFGAAEAIRAPEVAPPGPVRQAKVAAARAALGADALASAWAEGASMSSSARRSLARQI